MHTLYDTRTVHPLDRYEYYRAAAASELVPVTIHGRPPSQLLAMMSGAKIGDFTLEVVTWAAVSGHGKLPMGGQLSARWRS
jgi:hypothetical protein